MHHGLLALLSAVLAALLLALTPSPAAAQPTVQALCTPADPELTELSGLATDGDRWFAVSDGGSSLRVLVLNPAGCAVLDEITADVNPYDVEDLALARDGALWLADTGDNDLDRSTVALHRLTPDGAASLYRLTYPDGPHDAEALLLDQAGVPYVVTKELGPARVYRPAGVLVEPGPTTLEQVVTVRIEPTSTPGGPVGGVGSVLVTGGAVSTDRQLVALRTYTDAYLFSVPGGDVVAALAGVPVRIPLPDEPQGEALALAPDGTLLSGSEGPPASQGLASSEGLAGSDGLPGSDGVSGSVGNAPIRAVPGAAALIAPPDPVPRDSAEPPPDSAAENGAGGLAPWVVVAMGLAGLLVLLAVRRRERVR